MSILFEIPQSAKLKILFSDWGYETQNQISGSFCKFLTINFLHICCLEMMVLQRKLYWPHMKYNICSKRKPFSSTLYTKHTLKPSDIVFHLITYWYGHVSKQKRNPKNQQNEIPERILRMKVRKIKPLRVIWIHIDPAMSGKFIGFEIHAWDILFRKWNDHRNHW